jgi:TusA-related sulfurtransferase
MPIIKVAKAVKNIALGETMEITATDPVFIPDLEAWCRKTKQTLISHSNTGEIFVAVIEKSA